MGDRWPSGQLQRKIPVTFTMIDDIAFVYGSLRGLHCCDGRA
jgi:hypothetical protein